jgi:hypothetical protein
MSCDDHSLSERPMKGCSGGDRENGPLFRAVFLRSHFTTEHRASELQDLFIILRISDSTLREEN